MHAVEVDDQTEGGLGPWLEERATALLVVAGLEASELSVVLVDDAAIAELNRAWRSKPGPTDVLSFPQQEGEVVGGLLGDIVISVPTAARQAAELGHEVRQELQVLLVHGLCHLLGHDHHDDDDARAMAAAEAGLLTGLGVIQGLVARAGRATP